MPSTSSSSSLSLPSKKEKRGKSKEKNEKPQSTKSVKRNYVNIRKNHRGERQRRRNTQLSSNERGAIVNSEGRRVIFPNKQQQ